MKYLFLSDGYQAGGLELELVVLDPVDNLHVLGESYLAGPTARTTYDFLPVSGDPEALLMVVGVIPCSLLYSTCFSRRRSVSAMARSIDPVTRSA